MTLTISVTKADFEWAASKTSPKDSNPVQRALARAALRRSNTAEEIAVTSACLSFEMDEVVWVCELRGAMSSKIQDMIYLQDTAPWKGRFTFERRA